jgi:hypothetical protein
LIQFIPCSRRPWFKQFDGHNIQPTRCETVAGKW